MADNNNRNNGIFIPTEVATSFLDMQKTVATALIKAAGDGFNRLAESKERMQAAQHAHEIALLEKRAQLLKLEGSGTLRPPPKGAGRGKIPTCHSSLAPIHLPPATPVSQQE